MGNGLRLFLAAATLAGLASLWWEAAADETSTGDKLRILYSNRLIFSDSGTPLVTVELMSGQSEVVIRAEHGMVVRPDGVGGSEVEAGGRWTVAVEDAQPARVREWTVVERLRPADRKYPAAMRAAMERWTGRGHLPRSFEVGAVFGVGGEVIDSRETLIAIEPVDAPRGQEQARAIARRYEIETSTHRELVRRPRGTVVARGQGTVVKNPAVIWFAPARAGESLIVEDVVVGGGGSQLETNRETRRYAGSIYVTVGADGRLTAVNAVAADKFLAGLVPAEMYPDAPEDALAAQAIAARTDLLQKLGARHLTDPFMLCSSQHCQVYAGVGREHPRTNRAVERTRGMVLARADGSLVDARYSAACGGHGEHAHHVWDLAPDSVLTGQPDLAGAAGRGFSAGVRDDAAMSRLLAVPAEAAYCGRTRYSKGRHRWTRRLDAAEVSERVAAHYPGVGRVRALEAVERGVSGRILSLRIRGSEGTAIAHGELHIRRLLGGLRSTAFVVEPVGDRRAPTAFSLTGAGFGHGVGMCQLGAIGRAGAGSSFQDILRHYYQGSRIRRLY
ncbi:SpoIID/LytB domain-containing protein [Haliangium sp.]|uniref:SpoIID/LytB domain-containing protein n=1 Tax=Haliangium sp. TaxID=2663208 RepID=UPI003D118423